MAPTHVQLGSLPLTLCHGSPMSYRNQSNDLHGKSMDWFLYDRDFNHKRVRVEHIYLEHYASALVSHFEHERNT